MRRASLTMTLLVLLASLFLLSVLASILTGYPERPLLHPETPEKRTEVDVEEEPSLLLFKVSPVSPKLYWRISSADYYTGLNWLGTTDETVLEEFPQTKDANATKVFTVEITTSQREILLPLASANSTLAGMSLAQIDRLRFYEDAVANVFKVTKPGQANEVLLVYEVSWRDIEVDDRLISLNDVPENILNRYLQLPNIPLEVWKLAEDLEDSSYSVLDQILADVQFLRTNFVYDVEQPKFLYERITQGSDISSYIERRRGICIDAATALAIILRIQNIPARISIGYKSERMEGDKLLYYTTGAHSVTEVYLPPYGWIQFDATPPLEDKPLVKISPFKKESLPGSRLFYQLSIKNRHNMTDNFKLLVDSKQEWNAEVAPERLRIEALQTANALLKVTIPDDADLGEKDVVTITVIPTSRLKAAFSIKAIIQAENILHIPTTITLRNIDEAVIRGDYFWVNGTVLTSSDERVDNMTIFIFLTKSRESEGVIVGKGSSEQGHFQIESSVPDFMEIGDYKVITISLGTTQYAPSSSDSIIRVSARTRMKLGSEEAFLLGYGAFHGRLFWDNGTGFSNASISLKITSLATPSEVWEFQTLTSKDGSFRVENPFENLELYEVKGTFSGSEYIWGSNATRVIELKRGLPTIQIFGEKTAIRGEFFNITTAIQFEDIRVWGEPATVAFDNQLLTTIETGENGSYACSFLVDPEEKLGSHNFTVALEKGNVSAFHEVVVKSNTVLTTKVSDATGGMLLLFSASLSDDHGLPIRGAEIVIDDYSLSWKTDENGNLTFLLDTVKFWPENLSIAARFEGSELYLPVTTENEIILEPTISLPFLIPLVSPTLVVMVFMCAKHLVERRQTFRQTSDMEVAEKRVMLEKALVYKPPKMQPLKIVLPDIKAPFPYVWGVKDKLRIEIVLDKSVLKKIQRMKVEVFIDEENVASVKLFQQGHAEFSHVFTRKGEHKIRAILQRTSGSQPWRAEIRLRIVDYGEEIIRLYNLFAGKLASYGILAQNEMTAREIESLILRTVDFSPEALRKVTICFERAEYSNHLATRKDYEIMYLSLKELGIDVE